MVNYYIYFIFVSLILVIFYIYMLLYEGSYFISTIDLMKLSFISIFKPRCIFKVLFGVISIVALTWKMKGLLLFASFALIMMWCAYVTRKNRQFIDGKLEQNEANLQKLFKKIFIKSISTKYSLLLTSIILLTVAALCVYVTYTINLSIDSQKITPFPKLTAM